MAFDFQKQLAVGKGAEASFKEKFPGLLQLNGKGPDFSLGDIFIELKTDSYDYTRTGNFFMERFSDFAKEKIGGPWQALSKGSTVFCYFFSKNRDLFVFNTAKLVAELERNESDYTSRDIQNRGWVTQGYLVPVKSLEGVFTKYSIDSELGLDIFKV